MARTKNFADVIKRKLATNRALAEAVEEHAFQSGVADQIYNARTAAGITQAELARRIGSQQSVIARMEDADYAGHSLSMLTRIGRALGKEVNVVFRDQVYRRGAERLVKADRTSLPGVRWAKLIDTEITITQPTLSNYVACEQEIAA
jgi:ribosome-binding protein aMBF1 (putative translation factor)